MLKLKKASAPSTCISLFAEFVSVTGAAKILSVEKSKLPYKPQQDPYKQIREGIVRVHTGQDHDVLEQYKRGKPNSRKDALYQPLKAAYEKWIAAHDIQWVGLKRSPWQCNGLTVKVKPDLGLRIDGKEYMIKLWFKAAHPSPLCSSTVIRLLAHACVGEHEGATPAILDVHRRDLLTKLEVSDIDSLLPKEAARFIKIWDTLTPESAKVASAAEDSTGQNDLF